MGTWWCFRALRLTFVAGSAVAVVSACGGATRTGDQDGTAGTASTGGTGGAGGRSAGTTSLNVRDFDQSCISTPDCYPVRDGNQCVCGLCPTAAIYRGAVVDWEEARSAISGCPQIDCNHSIICEPTAYACRDNRCVVMTAPNIDPSSYDQTCREDEDCVAIPTGQWCTDCDCNAKGAVSNAGYARWTAEVNGLRCTNPGKECGCPQSRIEPVPACVAGRCEARTE